MMQNGMASPDLVEDDRKTNLIVNYLPQTMTQVVSDFELHNSCTKKLSPKSEHKSLKCRNI